VGAGSDKEKKMEEPLNCSSGCPGISIFKRNSIIATILYQYYIFIDCDGVRLKKNVYHQIDFKTSVAFILQKIRNIQMEKDLYKYIPITL